MAAAAAASVNVRLPFTAAQLQELERQTLIYKYMRASAPIPHELLLPITKSSSTSRVLPSCQPDSTNLFSLFFPVIFFYQFLLCLRFLAFIIYA